MLGQPFDQVKGDAFAEQLLLCFNGGALARISSIGYRTRLFDGWATGLPATNQQIAVCRTTIKRLG
ncbi:MAG TPA: hypothetical protein IGS37_12425 [Synechococcales cyanobacterium M55_K2018_004]|nr:hypothetical protein [Synechococcales cyanobacterium M55_K2018_004]